MQNTSQTWAKNQHILPQRRLLQILFVKLHLLITLSKEKRLKPYNTPKRLDIFRTFAASGNWRHRWKVFAPLSRNLENFKRVRTTMTLITCSAYIIPIYTAKCGVLFICSQVFQNLYSNKQVSHTFLFMSKPIRTLCNTGLVDKIHDETRINIC